MMEKEQLEQYNKMVDFCNALSDEELESLIKQDQCPYKSELLLGSPFGQFHCPLCSRMILAGFKHFRDSEF